VDHERAEAYLQLIAEAGLRSGDGLRVTRAAQVLTAVGALDDDVAAQILADFELAVGVREADPASRAGRISRPDPRPPRPARTARAPAAGGRVVPLGQLVEVRREAASGELCLLSWAQPASRGLLTMIARRGGPSRSEDDLYFNGFGATDDRGNSYGIGLHGSGISGPGEWILSLNPDPPPALRWLDLTAVPGGPAARIRLDGAGQPPPEVTVSPAGASPAGHLLDAIAMRLLAAVAAYPQYIPLDVAGLRVGLVAEGLGDVVEALRAGGAIAADSPVPGQLARLCEYLEVGGHGIIAPPADSLPERWRGVFIQLLRGAVRRGPAGSAAAAVALPAVDGIRFTVLGVHDTADRAVIFMHASGATGDESPGMGSWPVIWVRSRAGWHATRPGGSRDLDGEVTMDVAVMPPLGRDADWIEVIVAGRSAEVGVTLPLRWR
jgi:hypothetical protein